MVLPYGRRATDRSARSPFLLDGGCAIEGVTINLPTLRAAHGEVVYRALSGRGFALFTLNLDHLHRVRNDASFRVAYQRAALVTADGWPVVWLANRREPRLERTCGADLVEPVCESAALHGLPVFFVGPQWASQRTAISILKQIYPALEVAGWYAQRISNVPSQNDLETVARLVNDSGARLCFVCLGAPKQELLVDGLAPLCTRVGFLCVGAALDFISGHSRRAPVWLQRARLEWLWRLLGDPRRLGARYLSSAYEFFLLLRNEASR